MDMRFEINYIFFWNLEVVCLSLLIILFYPNKTKTECTRIKIIVLINYATNWMTDNDLNNSTSLQSLLLVIGIWDLKNCQPQFRYTRSNKTTIFHAPHSFYTHPHRPTPFIFALKYLAQ